MFSLNFLALIALALIFLIGPGLFRIRNIRPTLFIITTSYFFGSAWIYVGASLVKLPLGWVVLMALAGVALILLIRPKLFTILEIENIKSNLLMVICSYSLGSVWIYLWATKFLLGADLVTLLTLTSFKLGISNAHKPYQEAFAAGFHSVATAIVILALYISC